LVVITLAPIADSAQYEIRPSNPQSLFRGLDAYLCEVGTIRLPRAHAAINT
jgi:hypothetical protein